MSTLVSSKFSQSAFRVDPVYLSFISSVNTAAFRRHIIVVTVFFHVKIIIVTHLIIVLTQTIVPTLFRNRLLLTLLSIIFVWAHFLWPINYQPKEVFRKLTRHSVARRVKNVCFLQQTYHPLFIMKLGGSPWAPYVQMPRRNIYERCQYGPTNGVPDIFVGSLWESSLMRSWVSF